MDNVVVTCQDKSMQLSYIFQYNMTHHTRQFADAVSKHIFVH